LLCNVLSTDDFVTAQRVEQRLRELSTEHDRTRERIEVDFFINF
jgi:hypothetical protein